jgi:thymidylate kinase
MYIVISGVHGVGKSTLAKEVAKKIGGVYLTESVEEFIPPPQFGPKSKEKLASQFWHTRQILLKEKKIVDDKVRYVCDRGWADVYTYGKAILGDTDRDLFFNICDYLPRKLPDLHFVVYTDEVTLEKRISKRKRDNLKSWGEDDLKYAEKINKGFIKFANDFKDLRPIFLIDVSGTVEENVKKVVDIIKDHI